MTVHHSILSLVPVVPDVTSQALLHQRSPTCAAVSHSQLLPLPTQGQTRFMEEVLQPSHLAYALRSSQIHFGNLHHKL